MSTTRRKDRAPRDDREHEKTSQAWQVVVLLLLALVSVGCLVGGAVREWDGWLTVVLSALAMGLGFGLVAAALLEIDLLEYFFGALLEGRFLAEVLWHSPRVSRAVNLVVGLGTWVFGCLMALHVYPR
jgi:hypothetical protein